MEYIHIDSNRIRQAFNDRNLKQSDISRALGHHENHISANLSYGKMDIELLDKLCMILGINKNDVIRKTPPKKTQKPQGGVEKGPDPDAGTEKIVSYICDLGKIQTEMLRELHDLRSDRKELLNAVNTNILDGNVEAHNTAENVKNFAVATNQNLNKIHNLMKYGGK